MHLYRTSAIATALALLVAFQQLVGCSSDPVPTAGGGDAADAGAAPAKPRDAKLAASQRVYFGQTAKLDGPTIAPDITSKFAWTMAAVPAESAITTASIQDATTASPSFRPDALGSYTLQFSGEKDGASAVVFAIVEVIDAPVFIGGVQSMWAAEKALGATMTMRVVGTQGTVGRDVRCPVALGAEDSDGGEGLINLPLSLKLGSGGGDVWEGPPGTPSRVAFPTTAFNADLSVAGTLAVATSTSTCGSADARDVVTTRSSGDRGAGTAPSNMIFATRFSPDGARLAYIYEAEGRAHVSTIAFDGSAQRDLAPFQSKGGVLDPSSRTNWIVGEDVSLGAQLNPPRPPRWKDATHVGWASFIGPPEEEATSGNWEIWTVEDKEGATPELAMRCTGASLGNFEFLPDGSIVTSSTVLSAAVDGGSGGSNLLVYRANAVTKACEVERNLTSAFAPETLTGAAVLSPDKSLLAFYAGTHDELGGRETRLVSLFTVPVDGSRAPALVPGAGGQARLDVQPRWAAGGTMLTWGLLEQFGEADPIVSIPLTGGVPHVLVSDSIEQTALPDGGVVKEIRKHMGISQGCSAAPGVTSRSLAIVAIAILFFLRRRSVRAAYPAIAVVLGGTVVGLQGVGCGDDEAPNVGSTPDAGSPIDAGGVGSGFVITVSSTRASVYLGQTAKLDGAAIAPSITSKFVWTLVSAPAETAIKTESLADATTASPSFTPDRLGNYVLRLDGEKDGVAASELVSVDVLDAPVFFRDLHGYGTVAGGKITVQYDHGTYVAGVHRSTERAVDCPVAQPLVPPEANPLYNGYFANLSARLAGTNGDSWEGPPGTPSRVAIPAAVASYSSGKSWLAVATSESACDAGGAQALDVITLATATLDIHPPDFIWNARFSPDGNRIAYLRSTSSQAAITTIGFDGSAKRTLSPFQSDGNGVLLPSAPVPVIEREDEAPLGPLPPRWQDRDHVAWVTFVGDTKQTVDRSTWELWIVEDKDGAAPVLAMECTDSGLTHFEFLPNGDVLATARHTITGPDLDGGSATPMDLLVYHANASTKQCEIARNMTNNTRSDAVTRNPALSPDKTSIAFLSGVGLGVQTHQRSDTIVSLYTVPIDGSRSPALVPGAIGNADLGVGPRWAAGGGMITWGLTDPVESEGEEAANQYPSGRLVAIPPSGGTLNRVTSSKVAVLRLADGGLVLDSHQRLGMGQGCSTTPGNAPPRSTLGLLGVLGIATLAVRRARRSRRALALSVLPVVALACSDTNGGAPPPAPDASDGGMVEEDSDATPDAPPAQIKATVRLAALKVPSAYVVFYPKASPASPVVELVADGQSVSKVMPDGAHVVFVVASGALASVVQVDDVDPGASIDFDASRGAAEPLDVRRLIPKFDDQDNLDYAFEGCEPVADDPPTDGDDPTTGKYNPLCVESGNKVRFLAMTLPEGDGAPRAIGAAVVDLATAGTPPLAAIGTWTTPATTTWSFSGSAPGATEYDAAAFATNSAMLGGFNLHAGVDISDQGVGTATFLRPPAGFNDSELHWAIAHFPTETDDGSEASMSLLVDRTSPTAALSTDFNAVGPHFSVGPQVTVVEGSPSFAIQPSAAFPSGTTFMTTAVHLVSATSGASLDDDHDAERAKPRRGAPASGRRAPSRWGGGLEPEQHHSGACHHRNRRARLDGSPSQGGQRIRAHGRRSRSPARELSGEGGQLRATQELTVDVETRIRSRRAQRLRDRTIVSRGLSPNRLRYARLKRPMC